MTAARSWTLVALCLVAAALLCRSVAAEAQDTGGKLRKEKARLEEMRKRAEKTAAELDETLKREQAARRKVDKIRDRLARQRRLIARIDRKLSALARELEKVETEVRVIEEVRRDTRRGLERTAGMAFSEKKDAVGVPFFEVRRERIRYFATVLLGSETGRYARLTADKEGKENELAGIERKVQQSESRIAREKRVGDSLLSQRRTEAKRLSELKTQKQKKEKELSALRARVARMEALVSRIERKVREAERRRAGPPGTEGPSKFSSVPGGLVPPVLGKVVGNFGKYRDPLFDVEVENRGVEIEASSGSPIRAIGKGKVVFTGNVAGFGKVLIIQHGSGLFSVYGKAETFTVSQDQVVAPGQNIGRLPENPDGKSVLYLELRAAGTAIDPTQVIPLSR